MAPRNGQRLEVRSGIQAPNARPTASPVDTFSQSRAGEELRGLARGLSEFAPELQRFASTAYVVDAEEQAAKGEAYARELQQKNLTLAQATREGKIPAAANPFYRAAMQEQFGRVAADKWQTDLQEAVDKNEDLQKTTDLRNYDAFVATFRQQWLKENVDGGGDQYFDQGFGRKADAYDHGNRANFARGIEARLEKNNDELHHTEIVSNVRRNLAAGVPLEAIADDINRLTDVAIKGGRGTGDQLNRTSVRALGAVALELNSTDAVALIDLVTGGPKGSSLGATSYGMEMKRKVLEEVRMKRIREDEIYQATAKMERRKRDEAVMDKAYRALRASNGAESLLPFLDQLGPNSDAAQDLVALQSNYHKLANHTNETTKRKLYTAIYTPEPGGLLTTEDDIIKAVAGPQPQLTIQDADFLMDQLKSRKEQVEKEGRDIFQDHQFKEAEQLLKVQFKEPFGTDVKSELADKYRYASAMLRERWIRFKRENPGATPEQINKWVTDNPQPIIEHIKGGQKNITDNEMSPSPPPVLQGDIGSAAWKALPQTLVLTPDEIKAAMENGTWSDRARALFKKYGIKTPTSQGMFLMQQFQILKSGSAAANPEKKAE